VCLHVSSKSKLHYDRQSVDQSVLVSGAHLGPRYQFFFLLEILFRQLRVCYFVAPFLKRGRVCNLLLLLVLASAVPLGSALSDERSGLSFVCISLYMYIRYLHKIFTLSVLDTVQECVYKASFSAGSVQQIMP
jgi:hypothetical protein